MFEKIEFENNLFGPSHEWLLTYPCEESGTFAVRLNLKSDFRFENFNLEKIKSKSLIELHEMIDF